MIRDAVRLRPLPSSEALYLVFPFPEDVAAYLVFAVLAQVQAVAFGGKPFRVTLPGPFGQFTQGIHAVVTDLRDIGLV